MGTCFSRGHVASMESVTYTARNTRFPANLDSSGSPGYLLLAGVITNSKCLINAGNCGPRHRDLFDHALI
jgi:hypothetical protein